MDVTFGERTTDGENSIIKNTKVGNEYPSIKNREFGEIEAYIMLNSNVGASDIVYNHLIALFGAIPTKKENGELTTLVIIPTGGYNKNTFITNINQAVGFGYTVVEQDSPVRSWKIYYMSLGSNTYCVTYSSTYKRITVTSRT